MNLKDRWVHISLIVLIGIIVYSNTFHSPFVFDDIPTIAANTLIKDLRYFIEPSSGAALMDFFFMATRYVGMLTFAINYRIDGLNVTGYHIFNLAVHIINALLVYSFVLSSFRTPFLRRSGISGHSQNIALFSALIFAVHPIQTQAVTYIVQRFASLVTLFYLLAVVLYIKWRLGTLSPSSNQIKVKAEVKNENTNLRAKRYMLYAASLISTILAMETKENAFTLPIMIALYEFMLFEGSIRKRALFLTPYLLTMAIIPTMQIVATTISIMPMTEGTDSVHEILSGNLPNISSSAFHFTELAVITTYIRLLALPVRQNLYYDYPIYTSFLSPRVLFSFLFLSAIIGLGIYLFRKSQDRPENRFIAYGIFWFFITLLIESSIILRMPIFEHRVYLPSAGAIMAAITAAFSAFQKFVLKRQTGIRPLAFALIALILIFSVATVSRNAVWKDELGLWLDVTEKSQGQAMPHLSLGVVYEKRGMHEKAISEFQNALSLDPDYAEAHNNLGLAYAHKGLTDEAENEFIAALQVAPNHAGAHYNLGLIYAFKGSNDKAVIEFEAALKIRPDYAEAHNNLGVIYKDMGRFDDAANEFAMALRLKPECVEARDNLNEVNGFKAPQ